MHTLLATLLLQLLPAAPILANVLLSQDVNEELRIPQEALYYYRYNHIPLSVYLNGPKNHILLDDTQNAGVNAMTEMTCGPSKLHVCPSNQWYCNTQVDKCEAKKVVGDKCHTNDACFSGICDETTSFCAKPEGQFGARCMDDSQCDSGLACVYGLFNRDHRQCLDRLDRFYGSSCSDDNDCERPFFCTEGPVGGRERICSLSTGSTACIKNGEFCGGDMQCCSNKCSITATSRMPRCVPQQ